MLLLLEVNFQAWSNTLQFNTLGLRSSRPKLSPARNAELCGSKFYHHAKQYARIPVTICRVFFFWSKIIERDILLIYRACFVVNPGLTCFASSSLKERGMLHIHSAYFVSCWFKERDILTHTVYLTKISFVSLYTSRISVGRLTLRVSGDITSGEITFARLHRLLLTKHCDSRSGFSSTIPGPTEIWKTLDKNLIHKFHTSLPFIFMTGVQPPGPHPKSPIWQRTEVGVELKKSLTSWLRWVLHKSQGGHFGK